MQQLMRPMGLESAALKPSTSEPSPEHPTYPYLLRNLVISRPNQVWAVDITYIPMARGFAYLVAIIDWYSRRVLTWRQRCSTGLELSDRSAIERSVFIFPMLLDSVVHAVARNIPDPFRCHLTRAVPRISTGRA